MSPDQVPNAHHKVSEANQDPFDDSTQGIEPFQSNPEVEINPRGAQDPTGASSGAVLPLKLGRYVAQQRLGEGGFGIVYRGYDEELQRSVAIKEPHPKRFHSANQVASFLNEARHAARLRDARLGLSRAV